SISIPYRPAIDQRRPRLCIWPPPSQRRLLPHNSLRSCWRLNPSLFLPRLSHLNHRCIHHRPLPGFPQAILPPRNKLPSRIQRPSASPLHSAVRCQLQLVSAIQPALPRASLHCQTMSLLPSSQRPHSDISDGPSSALLSFPPLSPSTSQTPDSSLPSLPSLPNPIRHIVSSSSSSSSRSWTASPNVMDFKYPLPPQSSWDRRGSSSSLSSVSSVTPPLRPSPTPADSPDEALPPILTESHFLNPANLELCITSYSYTASNMDELSFAEGQIIRVLQKAEGGWWEGQLDQEHVVGWFPANYVESYPLPKDADGNPSLEDGDEQIGPFAETPGETKILRQRNREHNSEIQADLNSDQLAFDQHAGISESTVALNLAPRAMAIRGLNSYQDTVLKSLTVLQKEYYEPLQQEQWFPATDHRQIFQSSHELFLFHCEFAEDIKSCLQAPPESQMIGKLFVDHWDRISTLYVNYGSNLTSASAIAARYAKNAAMSTFLQTTSSETEPRIIHLIAHLHAPDQHLYRYKRFFQDITQLTPQDSSADPSAVHADHGYALEAHEKLTKLEQFVQAIRSRRERYEALYDLIHRIDSPEGQTLRYYGCLLLQEARLKLQEGPRSRERNFYLLEGALVILRKTKRIGKLVGGGTPGHNPDQRMKIVEVVPLDPARTAALESEQPNGSGLQFKIVYSGPDGESRKLTVTAFNSSQKRLWFKTITQQLEQNTPYNYPQPAPEDMDLASPDAVGAPPGPPSLAPRDASMTPSHDSSATARGPNHPDEHRSSPFRHEWWPKKYKLPSLTAMRSNKSARSQVDVQLFTPPPEVEPQLLIPVPMVTSSQGSQELNPGVVPSSLSHPTEASVRNDHHSEHSGRGSGPKPMSTASTKSRSGSEPAKETDALAVAPATGGIAPKRSLPSRGTETTLANSQHPSLQPEYHNPRVQKVRACDSLMTTDSSASTIQPHVPPAADSTVTGARDAQEQKPEHLDVYHENDELFDDRFSYDGGSSVVGPSRSMIPTPPPHRGAVSDVGAPAYTGSLAYTGYPIELRASNKSPTPNQKAAPGGFFANSRKKLATGGHSLSIKFSKSSTHLPSDPLSQDLGNFQSSRGDQEAAAAEPGQQHSMLKGNKSIRRLLRPFSPQPATESSPQQPSAGLPLSSHRRQASDGAVRAQEDGFARARKPSVTDLMTSLRSFQFLKRSNSMQNLHDRKNEIIIIGEDDHPPSRPSLAQSRSVGRVEGTGQRWGASELGLVASLPSPPPIPAQWASVGDQQPGPSAPQGPDMARQGSGRYGSLGRSRSFTSPSTRISQAADGFLQSTGGRTAFLNTEQRQSRPRNGAAAIFDSEPGSSNDETTPEPRSPEGLSPGLSDRSTRVGGRFITTFDRSNLATLYAQPSLSSSVESLINEPISMRPATPKTRIDSQATVVGDSSRPGLSLITRDLGDELSPSDIGPTPSANTIDSSYYDSDQRPRDSAMINLGACVAAAVAAVEAEHASRSGSVARSLDDSTAGDSQNTLSIQPARSQGPRLDFETLTRRNRNADGTTQPSLPRAGTVASAGAAAVAAAAAVVAAGGAAGDASARYPTYEELVGTVTNLSKLVQELQHEMQTLRAMSPPPGAVADRSRSSDSNAQLSQVEE
ncbi:uncharacterized protein BJ171DRAFT_214942, partial [Polychytrium aggregatum]|uniref:uncharacterized protein n=1 Tax=Polychytrium aggregatum TaxID=110093 RepID=UPI0022FEAD60